MLSLCNVIAAEPDTTEEITMGKHLLIVDDDLYTRKMHRFLLERKYVISEAENGADALSLLSRDNSFDLLVTDIEMPVMSGIELIEEMDKRGITTPTCVVSGIDDKKVISNLQRLGCSDFLAKPLKIQALLQRVETILERK